MGKVGIRIVLFLEGIKMGLYIHRNDLAKRKKNREWRRKWVVIGAMFYMYNRAGYSS